METELSLSLKVFRGKKPAEDIVIRHDRVLVGTGAHCDIRLDDVFAAREHAELQIEGEHVVARALSYQPPPRLDNAPMVGAVKLAQGAELAIGETRIVVSLVREANRTRAGRPRRIATAVGIALALVFLPIGVYAALRPPVEEPIGPPPAAAALWDARVTACKVDAPDQAAHLAMQMRGLGDVSRERYPFDIQDGIHAVNAYEMAAACRRRAAQNEQAAIDDDLANEIREVVGADYFAHRIRLEHAIESNDARAAYLEVKVLRQLTANLHGPYVDWLTMVERRLDLSLREVEKEKTGL